MGVLKRYNLITNYGIDTEEYKPYVPPERRKREYVVPEAVPITLADMDFRSADFITAHDLRDYRRTSFNLVMLPSVELSYDTIALEVYNLNGCL